MITFKEWLLERQMMMFSTKPVDLYHATNTGKNNSVIDSFKSSGAVSSLATGHGQGQGFYVWTDRGSAVNHAKAIIENPMVTTNASTEGLPMVVTIEAILEPEKWDLDYEINKKKLIEWIYDNHELVNKHLNDTDEVKIGQIFKREIPDDNNQMVTSKGVQFITSQRPGGGGVRSTQYAHGGSGVRSGELIGAIINKIQQKDPKTIHGFEELFFANIGPGVAIKYVGSEAIKPKRIEIFKDNQWINA